MRQVALLDAAREKAERRLAKARAVFRRLKLDPVRIANRARRLPEAQGGPFIPAEVRAGADGELLDRMNRIADVLSETAILRRELERLPVRKPMASYRRISSRFGYRSDPFRRKLALHAGIDFKAAYGASVLATAPGTVIRAGWTGSYGKLVEIRHDNGLVTRYAHLSRVRVRAGQRVRAGDRIGRPSTPAAKSAQTQAPAEAAVKKVAPTADLILEGNLATNGELQIDGTVHGAVQASVCIIEANGVVHGSVMAEEVFIRGRVIGPICGVRVTVVAGAHVEGDILNQSIAIENGAYVDGKIKRSEDPMGDWQRMWYGEEGEPQQLTYEESEFGVMESEVMESVPGYEEEAPAAVAEDIPLAEPAPEDVETTPAANSASGPGATGLKSGEGCASAPALARRP